mmetsp:Transcript_135394/g.235462  ORF Transcript_135394/g.235462 Transcript_135394/m.235462 type:complete len:381 (-) Transcript_135394:33-1175(-)
MPRFGVTPEERRLLGSVSFSMKPLATAGILNFWQVIVATGFPLAVFVFGLATLVMPFRYKNESISLIMAIGGEFMLLFYPTVSFFVLATGVLTTKITSRIRTSAVIYWLWWPFWKFFLCIVALLVAVTLGDYLWYNNFRTYQTYARLQAYDNLDAYYVNGNRVQDAGLVKFNETLGVDRSRAGCLVDRDTYCVAPIIRNATVIPGEAQTRSGYYDFFMAGINCCNCPVTDFRCGDWNNPDPRLGGMRLLNEDVRRFYRLAAQKWSTTYNKPIKHSVFFNWVADPVATWNELHRYGMQILILALISAIVGVFAIMVALNGLFRLLLDLDLAAPIETPAPPPTGVGENMMSKFAPDVYNNWHKKQQAQMSHYRSTDPKFLIL